LQSFLKQLYLPVFGPEVMSVQPRVQTAEQELTKLITQHSDGMQAPLQHFADKGGQSESVLHVVQGFGSHVVPYPLNTPPSCEQEHFVLTTQVMLWQQAPV
jgi:hypothetical protein